MDKQKEKRAIDYLKMFEPQDQPYYLCYSGGKDSDCIKILAQLSNVKFDAVHNLTTVDAPETVNYIKSQSDVIIEYPNTTMWKSIVTHKIPPTRLIRYCCGDFKESKGKGRLKITGVRWSESSNRVESADVVKIIGKPKTTLKEAENLNLNYRITKQNGIVMNDDNSETRRFVEQCYRTRSAMINPIVDWTDTDVWEFLKHYGCSSNPLYHCGFKRIGCIGCPMAGKSQRKFEFSLYPKYAQNYIKAFERMLSARKNSNLKINEMWYDGTSVFKWWLEDDPLQLSIFDDEY